MYSISLGSNSNHNKWDRFQKPKYDLMKELRKLKSDACSLHKAKSLAENSSRSMTHRKCAGLSHSGVTSPVVVLFCIVLMNLWRPVQSGVSTTEDLSAVTVVSALIRYSYHDMHTGQFIEQQGELGRYARTSAVHPVSGRLVHVLGEDGTNHGCSVPVKRPSSNTPQINTPQGDIENVDTHQVDDINQIQGPEHSSNNVKHEPWIALVKRGQCRFQDKVFYTAVLGNASAVVVYNHLEEESLITMHHPIDYVVSVFISKEDGDHLASLADSGLNVKLDISIGQIIIYDIVASKSKVKPSTVLSVSLSLGAVLLSGLILLIACAVRRVKKKNINHVMKGNLLYTQQKDEKSTDGLLAEQDVNGMRPRPNLV